MKLFQIPEEISKFYEKKGDIVLYPDPILFEKAKAVDKITDDIKQQAQRMEKLMIDASGVGLAAPQIGISNRVIVVKIDDEVLTMVNPLILSAKHYFYTSEACLSLPGIIGDVRRARQVRVLYTDLNGETIIRDFKDAKAVCVQHEIDHLDGILFVYKAIYDSLRIIDVNYEII